jgi:hypothetical protein
VKRPVTSSDFTEFLEKDKGASIKGLVKRKITSPLKNIPYFSNDVLLRTPPMLVHAHFAPVFSSFRGLKGDVLK